MNAHTSLVPDADHHDQIRVPKPIMVAMAALMLFAILSIATARRYDIGLTREATTVLADRTVFRFSPPDPAAAAIVATRADGRHVLLASAGEEIFPRLILRSVVNERERDNAPPYAPLTFGIASDGQRLLIDDATHHVIRLAAFGGDHDASFDALLEQHR